MTWLYIAAISAATVAVLSFVGRYRRWMGPCGLTLESRGALKALAASSVLLVGAAFLARTAEITAQTASDGPGAWRWLTRLSTGAAGPIVPPVMFGLSTYLSVLSFLRGRWRKIEPKEIALWCRELGLLVQQGMPILKALDVVAQECRSYRLYEFTLALREAVRSGEAVSDWACIPPLTGYAAEIIRAGEDSGDLGSALIGLGDVFERGGSMGKHERRPTPAKEPKPTLTEVEFVDTYLNFPDGAREAEKLLSTRVAGTEVSEVLAAESPIVRVVNIVLADAIRKRAAHVFFVSNGSVSVEYGDEHERQQVMTLPNFVRDPVARRLKLMADIAYWRRPPATGFINVAYDGQPYRLVLWVEPDEEGRELLRLDILPPEVDGDR